MSLSKRAELITSSPTLAITARAKAMRAEGIDVIGFGAGEPDFDTPSHIKEAAKRALDEGFTKYTPVSGIEELKKAICQKLKKENSLDYRTSEIIVSCGAKHCLYNALQVLCQEGEEVILPAPYWVSYIEQIKLAGARPVLVETGEESGFKIFPSELKRAITSKTKLFLLNSPNNPTGAVYSKEELEALAEILKKEGIYVISDEIYERIVYDDVKHTSIASLGPEIKKLTVLVNGVSKTYSMTGWRIGYAAGGEEIIKAMANLQSHSTSNPTSIAQKAALAAICEKEKSLEEMLLEFRKRRDYMIDRIEEIPGISCLKPQGAFYLFVNVSAILGRKYNNQIIENSLILTELLLSEAKVAVVPGSAFGAGNYLRLSYATSMDNIVEGLKRIEKFIENCI